jgi:hypothetical protein
MQCERSFVAGVYRLEDNMQCERSFVAGAYRNRKSFWGSQALSLVLIRAVLR